MVLAARKMALYFWMRFVHSVAEEELEEESVAKYSGPAGEEEGYGLGTGSSQMPPRSG